MNKKILMGLLSVMTIPLLAACQGGETPSEASKNSQTVTTQSSAKTESTSTTRSVAQTTSKEEVKEPMKTYEVGALLEAANQRDTKKVKEILQDTTYQVDEVDTEGNTPLNIAVHNNDIEIAKALIDRDADINLQNSISDSPYLYAGAQGRTEILAYMLKNATPDLNKHNRYGGNALIPAAEKGHIDNVKLLLEDGREDIDFQNDFGYTALIEAVGLREGNQLYQDIVKLLMENGADQSIKDNSGRTAMDYANQKGYTEISKILAQYN